VRENAAAERSPRFTRDAPPWRGVEEASGACGHWCGLKPGRLPMLIARAQKWFARIEGKRIHRGNTSGRVNFFQSREIIFAGSGYLTLDVINDHVAASEDGELAAFSSGGDGGDGAGNLNARYFFYACRIDIKDHRLIT
jgi:hypothetical protein